jgi:hypothetical protein
MQHKAPRRFDLSLSQKILNLPNALAFIANYGQVWPYEKADFTRLFWRFFFHKKLCPASFAKVFTQNGAGMPAFPASAF